ncbi:MAG: hypothetical protein KGH69_00350 [Candidatus Micrarchaeota archaeon]|nr:hypothetical protein [Candidatus Micrarchaeota archaeon]
MARAFLNGLLNLVAICFVVLAVIILMKVWGIGIPFLNVTQSILANYTVSTIPVSTLNGSQDQGSAGNSTAQGNDLYQYALSLINKDRNSFGLPNVSLASEVSGQQHSDSMLQNNYFSHWDTYGMKPYMRYTLVGGTQAVSENVAYEQQSYQTCIVKCYDRGTLNPANAIYNMEYSMMYNDSICCSNGHRENILDPNHNQVSIGIAYNSSTIYFTEDFIDSYINWSIGSPGASNGTVLLKGSVADGYSLQSVQIGYDDAVRNMTMAELAATRAYGYGDTVGGVSSSSFEYYPGLTTIVANRYSVKGGSFDILFNMGELISKYGAGEYTVEVWLNKTGTGSGFIGSTYTVFVNSEGRQYVPQNV